MCTSYKPFQVTQLKRPQCPTDSIDIPSNNKIAMKYFSRDARLWIFANEYLLNSDSMKSFVPSSQSYYVFFRFFFMFSLFCFVFCCRFFFLFFNFVFGALKTNQQISNTFVSLFPIKISLLADYFCALCMMYLTCRSCFGTPCVRRPRVPGGTRGFLDASRETYCGGGWMKKMKMKKKAERKLFKYIFLWCNRMMKMIFHACIFKIVLW